MILSKSVAELQRKRVVLELRPLDSDWEHQNRYAERPFGRRAATSFARF